MKKINWKRSIWLGAALILLLVDILVKMWAAQSLKPIGELPIWNGVIGFRYAENTGAAFSACVKLASREENAGKNIVTVFQFDGGRYVLK